LQEGFDNYQQALATCRKQFTQSTGQCDLLEGFDNYQQVFAICRKVLTTIKRLLRFLEVFFFIEPTG
jgi:hypothetical protein